MFTPAYPTTQFAFDEWEESFLQPDRRLLVSVERKRAHNGRATHPPANHIRSGLAQALEDRFCRWRERVRTNENRFFSWGLFAGCHEES